MRVFRRNLSWLECHDNVTAGMAFKTGSPAFNSGRIHPVFLPAFFANDNHLSNSPE
jgi:hypothetical protein